MTNIHELARNGKPYVLLPRELLTHPPIRTKNCTNPGAVAPFEFAIVAAIVGAAWSVWSHDAHDQSFEHGGNQIEEEKEHNQHFRESWRETRKRRKQGEDRAAPIRYSTFQKERHKSKLKTDERIRKAGNVAYNRRRKKLAKQGPPDDVTVKLSRYKLLRLCGLPDNPFNRTRLDGALNRATLPVGALPPPVRSWQTTDDGLLQLRVSAKWLDPPFGPVPLPLPVHRSPMALALFLFLYSGIKTHGFNKVGISVPTLLKHHLGMSAGARIQRTIDGAIDVINKHLGKLPEMPEHVKIKVPLEYKIVPMGGDRIRFESIPRPCREDDDEPQMPPPKRTKTRRTAKTGRTHMADPVAAKRRTAPETTPAREPEPEPAPMLDGDGKPRPPTSEEVRQRAKTHKWKYTNATAHNIEDDRKARQRDWNEHMRRQQKIKARQQLDAGDVEDDYNGLLFAKE